MQAPICPLCKINECDQDTEPGRDWRYYESPESYSSMCTRCMFLSTTREHSHQHYPSPAQVKAGTWEAGHSWRTAEMVRPVFTDGKHTGYRCERFEDCGWERVFTAEEMEECPDHVTEYGLSYSVMKAVCHNSRRHRLERGEVELPHGYITDHGREVERIHSDATVWDPGKYIEQR